MASGKFRELKTFGVATDEADVPPFYGEAHRNPHLLQGIQGLLGAGTRIRSRPSGISAGAA